MFAGVSSSSRVNSYLHLRIGLLAAIGVQNNYEITDVLKHGTRFAVCLFPVANSAWFLQKGSRV